MSVEDGGPAARDDEFDLPDVARLYDRSLGGAHNVAADRGLADRVAAPFPGATALARANRTFLRLAVTHCLSRGIHQSLDLGSGIPTVGNVHEIAHGIEPEARVTSATTTPSTPLWWPKPAPPAPRWPPAPPPPTSAAAPS